MIKYKLTPEQLYEQLQSWINQNKRLSENEMLYMDTRNFHYQIYNYQTELLERLLEVEDD